jgi:hypothetical protein
MTTERPAPRTEGLTEVVAQLAAFHSHSPALIVRTPAGGYEISPDGMGGGPDNRYLISRSQLGELMWEHGVKRDDLRDPGVATRIAAVVAEYRPRRSRRWG